MLKHEVEVGATYRVRWHDGSFTNVRIIGATRVPVRRHNVTGFGYGSAIGSKTQWRALNLATGRYVTIKSAAKLRERVS